MQALLHQQVNKEECIMANAKKHMERSHRSVSHKRNEGIFNDFSRRAYSVGYARSQRKTLGQKISQTFKNIFKRTKAC